MVKFKDRNTIGFFELDKRCAPLLDVNPIATLTVEKYDIFFAEITSGKSFEQLSENSRKLIEKAEREHRKEREVFNLIRNS